jgi:glycine/D-amino acid oxidase-like deaminating enzyme
MTVVVVGGGVLGMRHALEATRLGHDVVHLLPYRARGP